MKLYFVLWNVFLWKAEWLRGRKKENGKEILCLCLLVHSPNGYHNYVSARRKPGARNSILASYTSGKGSCTHTAFPEAFTGRWIRTGAAETRIGTALGDADVTSGGLTHGATTTEAIFCLFNYKGFSALEFSKGSISWIIIQCTLNNMRCKIMGSAMKTQTFIVFIPFWCIPQ